MKNSLLIRLLIVSTIILIAVSASAQDISYINSINWSFTSDIKVRDNIAYCLMGSGLQIMDITDIENPEEMSRLFIANNQSSIKLEDNYAIIYGSGVGNGIIHFVDITDPLVPVLLTSFPINAAVRNIFIEGDKLYLTAGRDGFYIIDISDAANPEILCAYDTGGITSSIAVVDTFAFVAGYYLSGDSKPFSTYSVNNPQSPHLLGYIEHDIGSNSQLIIDGDYAYLANGSGGLVIIDISRPQNPEIVTRLENETYPLRMAKEDDYLFLSHHYDLLQVYDVSTPADPQQVSSFEYQYDIRNFDIEGDNLYNSGYYDGISVLDISDPGDIEFLTEYDIPDATLAAFLIEDYLYIGEKNLGFRIHTLDEPSAPEQTGIYDLPLHGLTHFLTDQNLYLMYQDQLYIIDISDPSSPGTCDTINLDRSYLNICVKEPYIYLMELQQGIFVYERIGRDSLEFIRSFTNEDYTFHALIDGNLGYFSQSFMLHIYDITDPADSTVLGSMTPYYGAGQLYLNEGYIYTQCMDGSLSSEFTIIDVNDSENPMEVNRIEAPSDVTDIEFKDQYAYMGIYGEGIYIYDISDPAEPQYVCHHDTPGYVRGLALYGDYIYVADLTSLVILKLTPTGIEEIASIPNVFMLSENYPNPFNAKTIISYDLPANSEVKVDIYDMLGRKVQTMLEGFQLAGKHSVTWNADNFASGMYFYKLTAGKSELTNKMLLVK